MEKVTNSPLLIIDNLLRTLMIAGAILIAGLIIARPVSMATNTAIVALMVGFLSFVLTSQFLVTIEMGNSGAASLEDKARDSRLRIPFLIGYSSYITAGVFICVHFIAT